MVILTKAFITYVRFVLYSNIVAVDRKRPIQAVFQTSANMVSIIRMGFNIGAIFNNQWNEKSSFPVYRWIEESWPPLTTNVHV